VRCQIYCNIKRCERYSCLLSLTSLSEADSHEVTKLASQLAPTTSHGRMSAAKVTAEEEGTWEGRRGQEVTRDFLQGGSGYMTSENGKPLALSML